MFVSLTATTAFVINAPLLRDQWRTERVALYFTLSAPHRANERIAMTKKEAESPTSVVPSVFAPAIEYMVDAAQRTVLFWDVMRQRGNQYQEHVSEEVPHVLDYAPELVIDGRTLERPVNYA